MPEFIMMNCSAEEWEIILPDLPQAHFLQTNIWASIKASNGWKAYYLTWKAKAGQIVAGAMVLERQTLPRFFPIRMPIHYSPKGPLLDWSNSTLVNIVLKDIADFSRMRKAIFIKIDPEIYLENPIYFSRFESLYRNHEKVESQLKNIGWHFSDSQIQFQNTMWIDLQPGEEEILAGMKQKTRYNIRLAEKKDIKIRIAVNEDFETVYRLYAETSIRDQFIIRSQTYYLDVWKKFTRAGMCTILLAEFDTKPIAALVMYYFGGIAYYIYGMSSDQHRNFMPTYLLQWEAIKLAKAKGATIYDLWGAPTNLDESDSMYGVYRFKVGLGGELVRTIGAWDMILRKSAFLLYQNIIPIVLSIMRKLGRKRTVQSLD